MATRATVKTRTKVRPRVSVDEEATMAAIANANYFTDSSLRTELEFFTSGCRLLDMVLGGGWVLGRMSNIIGDKSTGKTLLVIEAVINFLKQWDDGFVRYAEAEAAFEKGYAAQLGMPVDRVDWAELIDAKGKTDRTIEWMFDDIRATIAKLNGRPGLYIVDSLDAFSDRAEMERDIGDGSYGGAKAKKLGEMFRRLVGDIEESRLCLLIISQIRDKINARFGETKIRSGGHAMDFYATHCLWLSELDKLTKTVAKIERTTGMNIRAKCKKNKVGLAHRECDFPLVFGYGIDDMTASVEWLIDAGREQHLADLGLSKAGYKVRLANLRNKGGQEARDLRKMLDEVVVREWQAIERTFLPEARKY